VGAMAVPQVCIFSALVLRFLTTWAESNTDWWNIKLEYCLCHVSRNAPGLWALHNLGMSQWPLWLVTYFTY
jgi:hypothetical protein